MWRPKKSRNDWYLILHVYCVRTCRYILYKYISIYTGRTSSATHTHCDIYVYTFYVYGRYKKRDHGRVLLFTNIQLDEKTEYNRVAQKRIVFTPIYCGNARATCSPQDVCFSLTSLDIIKQNKTNARTTHWQ